jgi:hypothetical protein
MFPLEEIFEHHLGQDRSADTQVRCADLVTSKVPLRSQAPVHDSGCTQGEDLHDPGAGAPPSAFNMFLTWLEYRAVVP